jgi:hypothetical protein
MSMPKFPNAPNLMLDDSIAQIISSIAMEELALSHILNAEGEKIQYALGTLETPDRRHEPIPPATIDELLEVNESVKSMLCAVSMNQMLLLSKMSSAMDAYFKLKNDNGGENPTPPDPPNPPNPPEPNELPLTDGEGPYDTRVSEGDWENKSFSMKMKIKVEQGSDNPEIVVFEPGAVKLEDILSIDDFSGITVRAEDSTLDKFFRIGTDKSGDAAIIYSFYPEIPVWEEALPELPVVEKTLILSKAGYADAKIRVILRYDGSLFVSL